MKNSSVQQELYTAPQIDDSVSRHEELRAIRALGILLESKLIDQMEYERRIAPFQRKN
jgi:hypothetical protein